MNEPSPGWARPLGASTVLFVLYGAVWLLIGVLTPFLHGDRAVRVARGTRVGARGTSVAGLVVLPFWLLEETR